MKFLYLSGIAVALTACTDAPDLVSSEVLAPVASPHAQIRHVHGHALLSEYVARPVKGPDDWRKLNDQQSPARQEGS